MIKTVIQISNLELALSALPIYAHTANMYNNTTTIQKKHTAHKSHTHTHTRTHAHTNKAQMMITVTIKYTKSTNVDYNLSQLVKKNEFSEHL